MKTQKIIPYLWFDDQAEAAVAFYTSVFPDSRIVSEILFRLMHDADPVKAERVSAAMLKMIKLDIAALQRACDGV